MPFPKATPSELARADLAALPKASEDYDRFDYAVRAAWVKRNLLIRRARAEGAAFHAIATAAGLSKRQVQRIYDGPEPVLHRRPHRRDYGAA